MHTQKNSINNVAQKEQQTVFINLHNHSIHAQIIEILVL